MMRKYALNQGSKLLRKLVFHLNRAALLHDPDSIHDVRVAIRRFQQFLSVFEQFVPRGKAKKIRRQLREVMELSGEVRNPDIASALLHHLQALRELPADLIIPPRLELSEASFSQAAELTSKSRTPTEALRQLMTGRRPRGRS